MDRPRLSLTLRIALALTAVGLLPLLTAFFLLERVQRRGFQDQVLQTHSITARTAAERTAAYLDGLETLGRSLASHPGLLADPRSEVAQALLAGTLESRSDLASLSVLAGDGSLVVRAQRRDRGDAAPLAERPLKESEELEVARAGGGTWLRRDLPFGTGGGKLRLVAAAAALEEALSAFELAAEEADLVLVDAAGTVLAGSARDLSAFPEGQVEVGRTGQVSGAGLYRGPTGEEVLGAFAPVGSHGWVVLSRQPAHLAEKIRRETRRHSLTTLGLALVLVSLLWQAGHWSLVRPIRRLATAQMRLVGIERSAGAGNELEELRTAFAILERHLHDRDELGKVFLGRYQVLELIGSGAMGTVFLGWDPKLERRLALKTVRLGSGLAEPKRRELAGKLRREAVMTARFLHPNIVAVHDAEAAGDLAFVAMEHVDGVGLERLLWARGSLTEDQAAMVGLAIARALAAAHSQGIVHRDIKPSNVLLGYDGAIKVTDFGIAELVTSVARPTETFFGTPGYVAPETLRDGRFDAKCDLFALGVVLYECLVGQAPFAARDTHQTLKRTLDLEPAPPDRWSPGLAPELEACVMSLLEKDPADRPESAGAVVATLEQLTVDHGWRWDPGPLVAIDRPLRPDTMMISPLQPTGGPRPQKEGIP
ncbi:MAG TPA: serine/threonine protein kinase [Thermoanaerobaculia bacterium]|nr:serine/threonine protein kinase [Thermoanaerobaculia bacterium]